MKSLKIHRAVSGNSLFELMIVIAIICGISFLSFSLVTLYDHCAIRFEIERLHALIVCLQQKSILSGNAHFIVLDKNNNCYRTSTGECSILTKNVSFGAPNDAKGPPSRPEKLIKDPITFPDYKILFYADGTISAGAVYLTNRSQSHCYALSCDASEKTHVRIYSMHGGVPRLL